MKRIASIQPFREQGPKKDRQLLLLDNKGPLIPTPYNNIVHSMRRQKTQLSSHLSAFISDSKTHFPHPGILPAQYGFIEFTARGSGDRSPFDAALHHSIVVDPIVNDCRKV